MNSIITGTGSYIPENIKKNIDFLNNDFYSEKNEPLIDANAAIIEKFKGITGIEERRYLEPGLMNSEIALIASKIAIERAQIDPESIDQIIFAHNFGDLGTDNSQSDMLPSMASKVKHLLRIKNPNCVAYDIIFGCPGWIQGMIQADQFIQTGLAKTCLVIGGETLSRIIDPHDRDSMIYSDGAGACILEKGTNKNKGVLSYAAQTYTFDEANYIFFGESNLLKSNSKTHYLKCTGEKFTNLRLAMCQRP